MRDLTACAQRGRNFSCQVVRWLHTIGTWKCTALALFTTPLLCVLRPKAWPLGPILGLEACRRYVHLLLKALFMLGCERDALHIFIPPSFHFHPDPGGADDDAHPCLPADMSFHNSLSLPHLSQTHAHAHQQQHKQEKQRAPRNRGGHGVNQGRRGGGQETEGNRKSEHDAGEGTAATKASGGGGRGGEATIS